MLIVTPTGGNLELGVLPVPFIGVSQALLLALSSSKSIGEGILLLVAVFLLFGCFLPPILLCTKIVSLRRGSV